ncbi:NAD(P)/FAD-dependent oxidoreductase [Aquabacter spiritensis]|uniref:Glycine/D-amino acid oxidase-like deaminating enzyme n=1 Tax=Aquabacter spiritensis TaxID=933073 RepID=A0A4R3LRA0_9HYPH|nr:FAD-binding oxidoreductase [Aquabacter spiritensis]TCT02246.1 glycine/D-amino acid oxidase-like deaminating enzyme [Aquabacter spiritensis]
MLMTSIWAATADPAPETPSLDAAAEADVAIVGAGYTGIAAALRLAAGGARVVVLDAGEPGAGASGRNGGQVIPGLKYDPDELAAFYGEAGVAFVGATADLVFDLVAAHGIACDAARGGWIQPTLKHAHLPKLHARAAQWAKRGAPVDILDAGATARLTGSAAFVGGWIDRRAGRLHPLNYMRGLLRAALGAGVRIHGFSRATGLRRAGGRWRLATSAGPEVTAAQVLIATNGYTDDLWPRLKQTVIPANSFQVATSPLDPAVLRRVLPEGSVVSDSRRVANYFRIGPGGRLMMGGRGSFAEPRTAADFAALGPAVAAFFPDLADVPLEFGWAGRIALTRDFLPHVHQPAPGITIALGYNGRGVALASALGTALGAHLLDPTAPLPLKLTDISPLPLHPLHRYYATAMIHYYRLRDRLER